MSGIERMTRYGRVYQILLDCDHILVRSLDEVKLQQLFVGKRIGCDECSRLIERGYDSLPGASSDARTSIAAHRKKPGNTVD
jgi:hypothetical protein